MTTSLPLRSEIAKEYTWNAESVFPDEAAWRAELEAITEAIPTLEPFCGRLGESPDTLATWLETISHLRNRVLRVFFYASMTHETDTTNAEASAWESQARSLWSRLEAAAAFAEPELLALESATLQQWAQAHPALAPSAHYLNQLERQRAHIRSGEVEELLSQLMEPFSTAANIHPILANADLRFRPAQDTHGGEQEIAQGTVHALLTSADSAIRRTAWTHYADSFLAYQHTMAACLSAGVQQNVFRARAKRYRSALDAALSSNFIPISVFHNLIATFRQHLPLWHRYWEIRRNALGTERLHPADVKAPLAGELPPVSFAQSVEWICRGMEPLGTDYVRVMRRGLLEERWVDLLPNQGKTMGAFSFGVPGTHPFILMSYNDDIFGLSTLAHELGHSMHSYLTWQTQPLLYGDYSLFVAEVASNFNQALVRASLLADNPAPEFEIAILEEAMANFYRYFFIMPTLARFELEIHERVERGEALTAESLNALMADLFYEGFGETVEVERDRVGITWGQFPTHLYANFYVYQYATGIAGAHALAERVLTQGPSAAEDYLSFLKAGSSVYPLDALQMAGVDLSSPAPVEQTFQLLSRYIERLAQLLGQ